MMKKLKIYKVGELGIFQVLSGVYMLIDKKRTYLFPVAI